MLGKIEGRRRRGWDSWMASLIQCTWVWVNSGSWWWTGRPGVLHSHGVAKSWTWLSDWTELNWFKYDLNQIPYNYTVEVTNRFKGLDLIDWVPEELWAEVHDIVQETGSKTIPKKKEMQKSKMAVWGGLTLQLRKEENISCKDGQWRTEMVWT